MGNGEPLDLYKLFMVVKKKGGYETVCKNRLWDLVGEEYGLGVKVGSAVELVYSKHLSALERCLKNVAGGKFSEYGLEGDRVKFQKHLMEAHTESMLENSGEEVEDELERRECGRPDGRKFSGGNRVKCVKPESNGAENENAYEYINGSKSCGSNSVKDKNSDSNGNEYDNVCDYLEGRKLCGTNRVNGVNPEFNEAKKVRRPGLVDLDMLEDHNKGEPIVVKFCGFNTEMDTPEEFDEGKLLTVDASDAESDMVRLSDGRKSNNKNDDDDSDEVLILDPSSVDKNKFGHKRKRESVSEMLIWINSIAKNPCDPALGSIPEKSKWKSCSSQEIWKQALLFRKAVFLKKDFETANEQLSWQSQKMHPSMYDDRVGALYNFRKRLKCDERSLFGKSTSNGVSSSSKTKRGDLKRTLSSRSEDVVDKKLHDSCSLDKYARVHIPVGPNHQAEVPEWTGMTCESDSKWLGTQIWPTKSVNSKWCLVERDPIGKGRQDSCGCPVQGSVECVRFHVGEKRSKVKMELGEAFFQWRLDMVGEEVRSSWTDEDEKKFKDVVKSNPASLDKCFWDHLFKTFPKKSREDLVCYYFNVFLLQQRAYQNRHTPDNIDSDDDESEFTPLRKVFGHQTPKSRNLTLLSPKKSTGKRANSK
ncbi:AT-rich interactive domain-containing protein 1 isoform X3 [Vigna unguiculata]|nr:AT-rich interactive domain-containing protein 1 isoform X3 [Vigna unguiculata]XP_027925531.1 AT-rich interactive domain-containing protein 1 isoform X3 [Vigna unguiculata]